uniref:HTH 3-helical bundle domain-containing protein n=1 Tax=Setaria viridis TaxID=4556 RepID=A0A4U6W277_SETVI|nr:hypothetical protein SEVIR_2G109800v2 [Setaria viridis]
MDPKFNGEWSASKIEMVKSLIASHNPNNNFVDGPNIKHNDIEQHQVIEFYVELVVEMMSLTQSGNHSVVAIDNSVNENSGIPVEDTSIDNMDLSFAHMTDKIPETMQMVDEVQFLLGMCEYGRGKWKDISRDFVTTNTPVKVSSHAQKYSINDVSLYDAEPWAQNISSNWEALAFAGGAYNPNYYGADQASSSQATTWTGQQMGPSSSAALALEGAGSQMACTCDQQGDILPEQWMDIDNV